MAAAAAVVIPAAFKRHHRARGGDIDVDDEGRDGRSMTGKAGREQNAFHARKRCQITSEGARKRTDG